MTRESRKRRTEATRREAPEAAARTPDDVVLVQGATEDGGFRVLRKRGDALHVGEMRAIEEGKPLLPGGEVVALSAREDSAQLFDVTTLYRVPTTATAGAPAPSPQPGETSEAAETTVGGGPAQVSTPAYREGWEAIWGSSRRRRGGPHSLN